VQFAERQGRSGPGDGRRAIVDYGRAGRLWGLPQTGLGRGGQVAGHVRFDERGAEPGGDGPRGESAFESTPLALGAAGPARTARASTLPSSGGDVELR
jgi:hypothetical protein